MHTYHFENTIPVAPLKIAAMESCRELGQKVNDYIVAFRKERMSRIQGNIAFNGYLEDSNLLN